MKPPVILIHGAWHAAWCWKKILPLLQSEEQNVLTPDLPGHGAQWQPPQTVTLQTYVMALTTIIQTLNQPVKLVGHSMAGMILSQIAEIMPDYIHELIFLSAYIPQSGDSLLTLAKHATTHHLTPYLTIDSHAQRVSLQCSSTLIPIFFNCCQPADATLALSQLQPQPLQPWQATVTLGKNFDKVSKKVIVCTNDRVLSPVDQETMGKRVTDRLIYLPADHAAYYSATEEIATLFK